MASINDKKLVTNGGCTLRMTEWTEKGRIRRNWTYQKIGLGRPGETAAKSKEMERSTPKSKRTTEEQNPQMVKKDEQIQIVESKEKESGQTKLENMVAGLTKMVMALTEKVNHIEASVSEIQHVRKTSQARTVAVESCMTTTMIGHVSEKRRHRLT